MDDVGNAQAPGDAKGNPVWIRGLQMLVFAVLFSIAQTILWIATVLQFGWMLFAERRNDNIAAFGRALADWMRRVAEFQTGVSDDKPFPWARWG